jgi:hypothetical protein
MIMARSRLLAVFATVAMLCGCGSDDPEPQNPVLPPGSLKLHFSVTNGVRANPTRTDELRGTVYGSCFVSKDVSLMGPRDGAVEGASVELADVDLTTAEVSANFFTTGLTVPPEEYVFLGMFDVDGNGAESKRPDIGDPATLPTTNKFKVVSGQETEATIVFDLVYNF